MFQSISRTGSQLQSHSPNIILLSRSDTAEIIQLAFEDSKLPFAHIRLDFFDRSSAEQFINVYLRNRFGETGRSEYNVALANPGPFGQLRRERFIQLISAILRRPLANFDAEWGAAKDFVGYAPVLIALAESLAVANPAAERSKVAKSQPSELNTLLLEIIDRIVDREHEKFVNQLQNKLTALSPAVGTEVNFGDLYSTQEQIARIYSHTSGAAMSSWTHGGLSGASAVAYNDAAVQFTGEHPFIRNRGFASVVFGDYVQASVGLVTDLRRRFTTDPCSSIENVGAFYLDFCNRIAETASGSVPESLLNALLTSWYAELELVGAVEPTAMLFLGDNWGSLTLQVHRGLSDMSHDFRVSELTGAPSLRVPLKSIAIICEQGLILGTRDHASLLGPDVMIAAAELEIDTQSLNIITGTNNTGTVLIRVDEIRADHLARIEGAISALSVLSTNPPSPLRPFIKAHASAVYNVPFEDYVSLRALLSSFRSTVHMGLCATRDRIDSIVANNARRQVVLRSLIERDIVAESSKWYTLNSSALNVLGFNFTDVRGGSPTEAMLKFLFECRFESHD